MRGIASSEHPDTTEAKGEGKIHNLARTFGQTAMVVKEVAIDETKDEQVRIVARKEGLLSWLLSLMGIDSTYTLRVYADRIESLEGSLSGQLKTVVPLTQIDTYVSGFTKPIKAIIVGVILILLVVFVLCIFGNIGFVSQIMLVAAIACLIEYFTKKCLMINFTTVGANDILFLFKRPVVEGINVDETFAERVCEIVKRNYIAQVSK